MASLPLAVTERAAVLGVWMMAKAFDIDANGMPVVVLVVFVIAAEDEACQEQVGCVQGLEGVFACPRNSYHNTHPA